jgi:hypothetical protein
MEQLIWGQSSICPECPLRRAFFVYDEGMMIDWMSREVGCNFALAYDRENHA